MITVFKISHLNTAILDDETLKEEIKNKDFDDPYSVLNLWINLDKRHLIFYKRYYNSLLLEYQLRFGIKLPRKFDPVNSYPKLPDKYWYNNKGVIEKTDFETISLKTQHDLVEKWKEGNPTWTNRFNNMAEVLNFMKGAENDYK